MLDAIRATPDSVRDTAATVLADPAYRTAARRLRDEIAAQPGLDSAVARLQELAANAAAARRVMR